MANSLKDLEQTRSRIMEQFLTLGDLRPGTVSTASRRCGKPSCRCAQPDGEGHTQFRVLRKVKGKSVSESFPNPEAFRQAASQVAEFHRFQDLVAQLTAVNEEICRIRGAQGAQTSEKQWTPEEKKRLLQFSRRLRAKSTAS